MWVAQGVTEIWQTVEQAPLLTLGRISIFHSDTHNQTGPLWCWLPSKWACAHSRPPWVSPTTSPVRLGVSPAASPTPTGVFNQRFEALFPRAGALGCGACFAPCCSSGLSVHKCGAAGSASGQTACPVGPTLANGTNGGERSSPSNPGLQRREIKPQTSD